MNQQVKIVYTKKSGLVIDFGGSIFNIDKDKHITMGHTGSPTAMSFVDGETTHFSEKQHYIASPSVRLGNSAKGSAVKGELLFQLLDSMAKAIDAKMPAGAPFPVSALVSSMKSSVLSEIVKVAD